nr:flavodoxin domain-containing protein [uncultured Sellimonas sp.]
MTKGMILHQSKYGAARRYAGWLEEETGFACQEVKNARIEEVSRYDAIILCGGIYASGIAGISFLRKHFDRLKGKRIMVFAVGASPYDEKAIGEVKAVNLKGELSTVPLFYGRGMWDEEAMSWKDRTLCRMLKKMVAKQDPETYEPWQKALVSAEGKQCDWTDREFLKPILKELKK